MWWTRGNFGKTRILATEASEADGDWHGARFRRPEPVTAARARSGNVNGAPVTVRVLAVAFLVLVEMCQWGFLGAKSLDIADNGPVRDPHPPGISDPTAKKQAPHQQSHHQR